MYEAPALSHVAVQARHRGARRTARGCVAPASASFGLVVVVPDGFDIVAVRVVNEGGVVARPVVAVSRPAVVLAPGRERRRMERAHLVGAPGFECDVHGHHGALAADPEIRVLAVIEASGLTVFHVASITEGLERLLIEGPGTLVVAHGNRGMCDHAPIIRHRVVGWLADGSREGGCVLQPNGVAFWCQFVNLPGLDLASST